MNKLTYNDLLIGLKECWDIDELLDAYETMHNIGFISDRNYCRFLALLFDPKD